MVFIKGFMQDLRDVVDAHDAETKGLNPLPSLEFQQLESGQCSPAIVEHDNKLAATMVANVPGVPLSSVSVEA